MPRVWIVHRDARQRAAIDRLLGEPGETLPGGPGDAAFETAAAPRVVVLGLGGDLEPELDFAHRTASRLPGLRWILMVEPGDRAEAERLFEGLGAELLLYPPRRELLRARVDTALRTRSAERLVWRRRRDALAARFARCLGDRDDADLLRALDPRLRDVPLLIRGEPGTGRTLLAQYVHAFGPAPTGPLVLVPGSAVDSVVGLTAPLEAIGPGPTCVCIEDADELPAALQHELVRWIELGPPEACRAGRLRWIATVGDDAAGALTPQLVPALVQALAGVSVRIPPLRERAEAVERVARAVLRERSGEGRGAPLELAPDALEALLEYPWPGNVRELEAVMARTIAAAPGEALGAAELRFDESRPAPAAAPGRELGREPDHEPGHAPGHGPGREPDPPADGPPRRPPAEAAPAEAEEAAPAPRVQPLAAPPVAVPDADAALLRRLAGALAHEIRNPLVGIRSFAALLPERAADPEFRSRFRERVGQDLGRIERVLAQLSEFADFGSGAGPAPESAVDLTSLLERELEARRWDIEARRLLVLKELERSHPQASGLEAPLALAFGMLLDHALEQVPERGDLYLASRYHEVGPGGRPSLRVLLRFHRPRRAAGGPALSEATSRALSAQETALGLLLAELLIRGQGGRFAVDESEADESLVVVDLPA